MSEEGEPFFRRWSRRKTEAREPPAPTPAAETEIVTPPVSETRAPVGGECDLPPVESLDGLASDYRDFLRPEVDAVLRRAALKKLFADPHFNAIDPFEAYSGDYTGFEPLDAAMLAQLEHARGAFHPQPAAKPGEQPAIGEADGAPQVSAGIGADSARAEPAPGSPAPPATRSMQPSAIDSSSDPATAEAPAQRAGPPAQRGEGKDRA